MLLITKLAQWHVALVMPRLAVDGELGGWKFECGSREVCDLRTHELAARLEGMACTAAIMEEMAAVKGSTIGEL